MKTRTRIWLSLSVVAFVLFGCVTQEQVRDIVDDSNRAAVLNSLSADPLPGESQEESWQDVVNRIETFIAENPDDQRTIAALRIREAVVLLNAEQANLARAVFDQVDDTQIAGARDQAIYAAREALIWWYGWDTETLTDDDRQSFEDALESLAAAADGLEGKPDIFRFLEETRVRMAVTFAENLTSEEQVLALLPGPLDRFEGTFSDVDRAAIGRWCANTLDGDAAILSSMRWFSYAPNPFRDADAILDRSCPDCFTPTWIQDSCPIE